MGDPIVDIGEVVEGRYKILSRLGEGGMSTVFLAEHWLIKRRVAMKIMHKEYAADADMIRRFMNEALAAGTLGHPNIAESTDMGFTRGDVPYIVFEYIEGTLLSDEIDRLVEMPVRRALRIAYQIASALDAAHRAGIVHRDLKSDNVFLTDRVEAPDHVKVIDFGISRFLAAPDRTAIGGVVMGTPEFMAPEQVTNPDGVDHRADIYALGIVLYEMLAKQLPFQRKTAPGSTRRRTPSLDEMHALLDQIINNPPPALVRAGAPPGLSEMIVDKLLAKDPKKRYQTMKDVQGAIEAFASVMRHSQSEVIPIISVPEPADPEPEPRPKRTSQSGAGAASRPPAAGTLSGFGALEIDALSEQTLSRSLLDPIVLAREVKQLGKRWSLDGRDLRLELFSRELSKLAAAITQVATIADELDHHPKLVVESPRLTLTIHAYDDQAITVLDLVFAARVEQWLRETGW
jgi:serine/threonine protein kinase